MGNILYVIRHGRTNANNKGLCLGWTDSAIAPGEKKNIDSLAKTLKRKKINVIFCSDLKRAKTTFESINNILKCENFFFSSDIRELNFGIFEHKSPKYIKKFQPEIYDRNGFFYYDTSLEKGESLKHLEKRVNNALKKMRYWLDKGNVLVITHGSVITMLHHKLKKKSYAYFFKNLDLDSNSIFEFNDKLLSSKKIY